MAISSPLTPKTSERTIKNLQGIILNKTRVSRETFRNKTILQDRRIENDRRALQEDALEAPDIVRRPRGAAQLIAGSTKGFFERLLGFLGYLTAGWLLSNLPTWIAMGKEFIARTEKMGNLIGGFLLNTTKIFNNITSLLGATLTNIVTFDFLDTSERVGTAFEELQLSVDNWGTGFEEALNLITSPLTEGVASGENAPPPGTQYTDEGAYETPPSSGGTPAPQVMLEGGISGTTALLPASAKGADQYIGATDRFGYSSWRGRHHNGIDIGTTKQKGYYVAFLLDGTATLGNQPEGAGLFVEIKSGGTTYKFFHLARFSIASGPYKAGTAIGEIGTTGSSTDIHLHYEVHPPGSKGVDPTPYLNLIKIGKKLGKPTPAPASIASSSTSQPQQNLMGTSSSGIKLGGGSNAEKVYKHLIGSGFTSQASAGVIGNLMQESGGGTFNINPQSHQKDGPGRGILQWGTGKGSGERWDALSAWAKKSGKDPWTLETQVEWMMKEMKDRGTLNRLKGIKDTRKATLLFENEMAAAGKPMMENRYRYADKALATFGGKSATDISTPSSPSIASAQTSTPTPAQITPTGTPQNPQMSQSSQALTPERTGPTVIVAQNPSSMGQRMMSYGGGGSSGGGSPQISEFAMLNNFIKNKLLLDLAYL